MSPSKIDNSFNITRIEHGIEKKCNFGAIVTGLDLNEVSEEDLARLKEAIFIHKILVIKDQKQLLPKKNWELMLRLDPTAPEITPDSFLKDFHPNKGGVLKSVGVTGIPGAENVHLIGKGYQGLDHYGIKDKTLHYSYPNNYTEPFTEEEFNAGNTRFQAWHADAAWFKRDPALFISFRTIKLPEGPEQTINWDDGSGLSMKMKPGRTAWFSSSQLYDLLLEEEKNMADHSWVEYMYYPFQWTAKCRTTPNGMGLVSEDREMTMKQMEKEYPEADRDPKWIRKYPMVWVNPLTGEKSFQVSPAAVRKLHIRHSVDEKARVIDDLEEVRSFLYDIQIRIVRPEFILTEPKDAGDLILWDNCGMMHTRIDYPSKYGPRTCHQAGIGSANPPTGPVPIPSDL